MTVRRILTDLQQAPFATAIGEGLTLFPWIQTLHVLSVVTVVGTIMVVDLRLLGVSAHRRSVRRLIADVLPFTWTAFAFALASGFLLFSSNAVKYADNAAFRIKLVLLLVAGANMIAFHLVSHRSGHVWDDKIQTPASARMAGGISLLLWVTIVFLGRWIGFTMV